MATQETTEAKKNNEPKTPKQDISVSSDQVKSQDEKDRNKESNNGAAEGAEMQNADAINAASSDKERMKMQ